MTTKITLYNSYESRFNGLPESLPELIQRLTEMLETVPSELHDEVVFEMSTEYESTSVDVDIYYLREETPEEQRQREKEDEARRNKNVEHMRREYERLKKHFDP